MMELQGLDLVACSLWKARNNADPDSDLLAQHLMMQEVPTLRAEARGAVQALYAEGQSVVPRAMEEPAAEQLLTAMRRGRGGDIAAGLRARLTDFYAAALREYERDMASPAVKEVVQRYFDKEAERRGLDAAERRIYDRAVSILTIDLAAAGFRSMPKDPPPNMMESPAFRPVFKAISLVFGEDPAILAGLYRGMMELQRIK